MMVKMTEDEPGDEGPWPPPDSMATMSAGPICNTPTVDSIKPVATQEPPEPAGYFERWNGHWDQVAPEFNDDTDVHPLYLHPPSADAARDYADMRSFQMRYLDADQALRALREAARAVVTEWGRVEEGKPDLTFAIASLADVLEGK